MIKAVVFFIVVAGIVSSCIGLELQPPPVPQEHRELMFGQPATLECLVETPSDATGRWFRFDGQNKTQLIDNFGSVESGYEPAGDKSRSEHNLFILKVAWRDQTVFGCSHIHRTPQWYYVNITVVYIDAVDSSAEVPRC